MKRRSSEATRILALLCIFYTTSSFTMKRGLGGVMTRSRTLALQRQKSTIRRLSKVVKQTKRSLETTPAAVAPQRKKRKTQHRACPKGTIYNTFQHDIAQRIIDRVRETPKGGLIALDGAWISNYSLIYALKDAYERGVDLSIVCDGAKGENTRLFEELPRQCIQDGRVHTKRIIYFDKDPQSANATGRVCIGSLNMSNRAGENHDMVIEHEDVTVVKTHYEDHMRMRSKFKKNRDKPVSKKRKALKKTQEGIHLLNTHYHDVLASKAYRVGKPIPEGQYEVLRISTMGFNYEDVAEALLQKAQSGRALVQILADCSTYRSQTGKSFLAKFAAAPVDIRVFWDRPDFDEEGKIIRYPTIQHTKILTRKRYAGEIPVAPTSAQAVREFFEKNQRGGGKPVNCLCTIATGNLCGRSNRDLNHEKYIPEDHETCRQADDLLDLVAKECKPFYARRTTAKK